MTNSEQLYNSLLNKGYTEKNIGDRDTFLTKMQDKENRRKLYDFINKRGDFRIGNYENYEQRIASDFSIHQPLQENIALAMANPMDKVASALRAQSAKPIGDVQASQNIGRRAEMTFNTPEQRSAAQVIADNDATINSPSLIDSKVLKDPQDPIQDAVSQDIVGKAASQEWQRDTEQHYKSEKERLQALYNKEIAKTSGRQFSSSFMDYNPSADTAISRDASLYSQALQYINDAEHHMNNVRNDAGLAQGVSDAIFNIDTLTLGLDSLFKNNTLKAILDKADADQPLTQAEESFLNAALYKQFTEAAYSNGKWYNIGKSFGEQIPYMLEFALSGGVASALTKGANKAIGKQVVKYINNLALKNGSKIANRTARNVFTRGSRMLGNTLSQLPGGVMRAAVQVPLRTSVYNDIVERQIGTLGYNPGEKGALDYTGRIDADNTADAITKGLTSGFITNLTESIGGEGIQFITNKIGGLISKGANAIFKDFRSPRWYNHLREGLRRNGLAQFISASSLQGPVAEWGEEILDQTLNAIFVGDSSLDPNSENYVFDLDNLIDTAITTGAISLFMGAAGGIASAKVHRDVNKAYAQAEQNLRTLHYTDTEINALNNIATSRPQEASKWVSSITRTMRTLAIRSAEIENSLSPEARTLTEKPYTDAEFNELSPYDQQAVLALEEIKYRFNDLTIQRDYVVAGTNYNALIKGLKESVAQQAEAAMADIQANALRDSDYTIKVTFRGQDGYLVSGTAEINDLPDGSTEATLPAGNIYQVRTKSPDGQWLIQQAVAEDITPGTVTPTQQLIDETTARIYNPVQSLINAEQAQAQAEVAQSNEQTTPTTEQTTSPSEGRVEGSSPSMNNPQQTEGAVGGIEVPTTSPSVQTGTSTYTQVAQPTASDQVSDQVSEQVATPPTGLNAPVGSPASASAETTPSGLNGSPASPTSEVTTPPLPEGIGEVSPRDGGVYTQPTETASTTTEQTTSPSEGRVEGSSPSMNNPQQTEGAVGGIEVPTTSPSTGTPTISTQAKLAHIASWQQAIDVPIVIFHGISEVDNPQAVANIQAGNTTPGWIANDTVYIYLPHAKDERDIDATIMHECIAHFGIPRLFATQEQANAFYDEVWNAMPEAEQYRLLSYPGVSHLKGEKARRVAADEYIAHLAEQIRAKRAGEAEVSLWQRIVAFFRNALRRANVNLRLNDTDLTQLLLQSLDALKKNNEQPKETTPDNALDPNEVAVTLPSNGTETRFSIRSFREEGRAKVTNWLDSKVADKEITRQEAQDIIDQLDTIYDICQEYTTQYAPFGEWSEAQVDVDANGNPVLSVIKSNGEYAMNLDFSLVCKKRRTLDAVFQEMIARDIINDFELDGVQVAKVNEIIRSYGFETACRLCFVDAKRFRIAAVADTFVELFNEISSMSDRKLRQVIKEEPTTVRGKAAQLLLNDPSQRIKVSRADFISSDGFERIKREYPEIMKLYNAKKDTGGPKASFGDVQYLNDIEDTSWTPDKAYAVGGVRLQSFSDYVPRMVFDYVQMIADLAAKHLPVHAYTKEDIFAKQFGLTGIKINLSLVPRVDPDGIAPGLDRNGNYAWQEGETFPYDAAIAIQNAPGYRDNCGTIAVGVSDEHILKMLDDENIRMVIPYHKSGLNPAVAIFNNIDAFVDYTNEQNTRYESGSKLSKDEKQFNFNEALRKANGNPRIAAQQYLDWCRDNNYLPKFDKFASHPNYYKLLEDFTTMYTVDGVDTVVPQHAVEMRFPTEQDAFGSMRDLIAEGLEADAILEGQRNEQLTTIVDEIAATLPPKTQAKAKTKTKTQDTRFRTTHEEQVDAFARIYNKYINEEYYLPSYAEDAIEKAKEQIKSDLISKYGNEPQTFLFNLGREKYNELLDAINTDYYGYNINYDDIYMDMYADEISDLMDEMLNELAKLQLADTRNIKKYIPQQVINATIPASNKYNILSDGVVDTIQIVTGEDRKAIIDKYSRHNDEMLSDEDFEALQNSNNPDIRFRIKQHSRDRIPNVRGGWTEKKILRYLKENPTRSGVVAAANAIADFDSPQELKEHMFYHGTANGSDKLTPSIAMSDRAFNQIGGGGGYGLKYWGISVSRSKKVSSSFSTKPYVRIYPIILLKDAKVIERPDFTDARDVEDHIVELWNEGVDAVWIGEGKQGKGEQELLILNPRAIVNIGTPDTYKYYKLGSAENPLNIADDQKVEDIYNESIKFVNTRQPQRPIKPAAPSILLPKEQYDSAMEQYQTELVQWEQKIEEYNNSPEKKAFDQALYDAKSTIRFRSISPEEQGIIDRAKANGTYLLAPNGQLTNLTPRQWAQVRTEAFKRWFGDWEKQARVNKLRNSEPINIVFNDQYDLNRDSAKQWMKDNIRGEYTNKDSGETIQISRVGINEVTSHGTKDNAHLVSISAIPQLIENSIFIEEIPNEKENDKYDSYRYYVCGAKINGDDYTIKVVIGVKGDSKYYDHRLTQIEKGILIDNLNGLSNSVAENQNASYSMGKDSKLLSILQTNASKIVDENGEPMVVYHYTNKKNISEFNPFRTNNNLTNREKEILYNIEDAYITGKRNLRRPFVGIWLSPYRGLYSSYGSTEYQFFVKLVYPLILGKHKKILSTPSNTKLADGDVWISDDGIIEEIRVTLPNQIKSATDNIGTFDANNPDIRFRIGDNEQTTLLNAKQPKTIQPLVNTANDVANTQSPAGLNAPADTRFRVTKRTRETINTWLNRRTDLDDAERNAFWTYIENEDPAKQLAMGKWFANGAIRLPEDQPTVDDAIRMARKMNVDPLKYNAPGLITSEYHERFGTQEQKETQALLSPDDEQFAGVLTDKVDYGNGITVYTVQDDAVGQDAVRTLMNDHLGKNFNCWCLLYADSNGNITESARNTYWKHYSSIPKRVAFKDGKICSFCASDKGKTEWWDLSDRSHGGNIPIEMELPGDAYNRRSMYKFNESTNEFSRINNSPIFRGNKKNGRYEEWLSEDTHSLALRANYKGGKLHGLYEEWHENGQPHVRANYKGGERDGLYEEWYDNGQPYIRANYKDDLRDGLYEKWYENGQFQSRSVYDNNFINGLSEVWYYDGTPFTREHFINGLRDGLYEEWYENGQPRVRANYKGDERDGLYEEWYQNGQPNVRANYTEGKLNGLVESWDENGQPKVRATYKDGERDGLYESWDGNGQPRTRETYKDGERDGLGESWYENGQLNVRANYKGGKHDGLYESWDGNGQPLIRANYTEGKLNGLFESWDENGQPNIRANYKDGKLDGYFEKWDKSGHLIEKSQYVNGERLYSLPTTSFRSINPDESLSDYARAVVANNQQSTNPKDSIDPIDATRFRSVEDLETIYSAVDRFKEQFNVVAPIIVIENTEQLRKLYANVSQEEFDEIAKTFKEASGMFDSEINKIIIFAENSNNTYTELLHENTHAAIYKLYRSNNLDSKFEHFIKDMQRMYPDGNDLVAEYYSGDEMIDELVAYTLSTFLQSKGIDVLLSKLSSQAQQEISTILNTIGYEKGRKQHTPEYAAIFATRENSSRNSRGQGDRSVYGTIHQESSTPTLSESQMGLSKNERSPQGKEPITKLRSIPADPADDVINSQSGTRFRVVEDADTKERFDREIADGNFVKTYRSMVLIDGELYPPMFSKTEKGNKSNPGQLRQPSHEGDIEQSEEDLSKATLKNGKYYITLIKDNNKETRDVAYNPYLHTASSPLNDQFKEAQDRPNMVTVEMYIPISELTSGYQAEGAHDPVGWKPWPSGILRKYIDKPRKVLLTQRGMVHRIVPDSEVASLIDNDINGNLHTLPTNVFTPSVRAELEKLGYRFINTNNAGKITEGQFEGLTYSAAVAQDPEYFGYNPNPTPPNGGKSKDSTPFRSINPGESLTDYARAVVANSPDTRFRVFGGNSGYVGYSMSKRAEQAREEGRYPKTDFKKTYGITDKMLTALVESGIVSNNEWHHTSKFGNKTTFYGFENQGAIDFFNENKDRVKEAIKNGTVKDLLPEFEQAATAYEEEELRIFQEEQEKAKIENELRNKYKEYINSYIPDDYTTSKGLRVVKEGYTIAVYKDGERLTKRHGRVSRDTAIEEYNNHIKQIKANLPSFEEWQAAENKPTSFRSIAADTRTADTALDTIEQATTNYADSLNTERQAIIDAITPAPDDSPSTVARKIMFRSIGRMVTRDNASMHLFDTLCNDVLANAARKNDKNALNAKRTSLEEKFTDNKVRVNQLLDKLQQGGGYIRPEDNYWYRENAHKASAQALSRLFKAKYESRLFEALAPIIRLLADNMNIPAPKKGFIQNVKRGVRNTTERWYETLHQLADYLPFDKLRDRLLKSINDKLDDLNHTDYGRLYLTASYYMQAVTALERQKVKQEGKIAEQQTIIENAKILADSQLIDVDKRIEEVQRSAELTDEEKAAQIDRLRLEKVRIAQTLEDTITEANEAMDAINEADYGGLAGVQYAIFDLYGMIDENVEAIKGDRQKLTVLAQELEIPTVEEFVKQVEDVIGSSQDANSSASQLWDAVRAISEYELETSYMAGLISRSGYQALTYNTDFDGLLKERYEQQKKAILDHPGSYDNINKFDEEGNLKSTRRVLNDNARIALNKLNKEYADAIDAVPMPGKNGSWAVLVETGWLTQQEVDSIHRKYEHYLPLKGHAEMTAEDRNEYESHAPKNQSTIREAKGHTQLARDVITQIVQDALGTIQAAERNKALILLYKTLTNNQDLAVAREQYKIQLTYYTLQRGKDGKMKQEVYNGIPTAEQLASGEVYTAQGRKHIANIDIPISNEQRDEHTVSVRVNGEDYTMFFYDKRIADAITGRNNNYPEHVIHKTLSWLNKKMAAFITSLSPAFQLGSNIWRDIQEMFSNTIIDQGLLTALKALGNRFNQLLFGKINKAVYRYQIGKLTPETARTDTEKLVVEYFVNGGPVNITQLPDYDTVKLNVRNDLLQYLTTGKMPSDNNWLSRIAERVELASRLSVYIASRNIGKSVNEAIINSKEATVNFDRKGTEASLWGSYIMFFNAIMQGVRRQVQLWRNHPARAIATYGFISFSITPLSWMISHAFQQLICLITGDDDEPMSLDEMMEYYYSFSPEYRQRNFILILGRDDSFRLPLALNYLPFSTIGDSFYRLLFDKNSRDDANDMALDVLSAFLETYTPVGQPLGFAIDAIGADTPKERQQAEISFIGSVFPLVFQPIAQNVSNYNFMGGQLYNEPFDKNDNEPYYLNPKAHTQDIYINISQWLSNASGGDEAYAGDINLHPEEIENFFGLFGFFSEATEQVLSVISMATDGEDNTLNDYWKSIPVLSRFTAGSPAEYKEKSLQGMFYNDKEELDRFKNMREAYIGTKKYDERVLQQYSPDEQRYFADLNTMQTIAKRIRTEIKAATPEGEAPKYHEDERLKAIYNLANEQFHSLASGQYKPVDNPYYTYMYIKDAIEKAPHRTTDGTYRLIDRSERSADSRGQLKQLLKSLGETRSMYNALPSGYYPGMPLDNREEQALNRFNIAVGKLIQAYQNTDLDNLTPADNAK